MLMVDQVFEITQQQRQYAFALAFEDGWHRPAETAVLKQREPLMDVVAVSGDPLARLILAAEMVHGEVA
ncbi:MAG TPA: hypothetical protein VGZ73_28210 [Bryobacteraceae bacterium]|nr:hypothetical protein [Bryobacteraceae bacterium]